MSGFVPGTVPALRRAPTAATEHTTGLSLCAPRDCCELQVNKPQSISRRCLLTAAALATTAAVVSTAAEASISAVPSASRTARAYNAYAAHYDVLDGRSALLPRALGYTAHRAATVSRAAGETLEIACGSGANFALYEGAPRLRSVIALDVSQGMLDRAAAVRDEAKQGGLIRLVQGDAGALPFPDEVFDTILDTFSLCVLDEPGQVLSEMARVLKRTPGSRVLLLEHAVSDVGPLAMFQNITAKPVAAMSKGCFWNQNVVGLASAAGLRIVSSEKFLAGTLVSLELCRMDGVV
jgi:methyltransferase OMS1, mitochondrial